MHRRISTTLNTLRQDLATGLGGDFIVKACRAAGHTWSDSCLLTPAAIIHWFLVQIFHGNTALHHVCCWLARLHRVRILSGTCRTPAGRLSGGPPRNGQGPDSCHREGGTLARPSHISRGRLGVLHARYPRAASPIRTARWTGQRLRLPDSPHPGCSTPAPGSSWRSSRRPLRSHDLAVVLGILPLLMAGDVLVADRGFCSFAHLALLMAKEAHAVFRLHQKQIVDFTPGRAHARPRPRECPRMPRRWVSACGLMDQVVEYFKPVQRPKWMSEDEYRVLPGSIMVRELRYRITAPGVRTREVAAGNDALGCRGVPG